MEITVSKGLFLFLLCYNWFETKKNYIKVFGIFGGNYSIFFQLDFFCSL